jgi:hypothetical protein
MMDKKLEVHKKLHQYREKRQISYKNAQNYLTKKDEIASSSHINGAVFDNLNESKKYNCSLIEKLSNASPSPMGAKTRSIYGDISGDSSSKKVR